MDPKKRPVGGWSAVFGVENAVGTVPEVFAKLCWSFHAPPPAGICGGVFAGGCGKVR